MARRRLQQSGDLYKESGWWKLRWREDVLTEDGATERKWSRPAWIGRSEGNGRLTEKQARRIAWEEHLGKLDQNNMTPRSIITLAQFLPRWQDEHVALLSRGSQIFYASMVKHLGPLGELRLRDIAGSQVQQLVAGMVRQQYSSRTIQGAVRTLHVVFEHASRTEHFSGRNPAELARLPRLQPTRSASALNFEQLRLVLGALPEPAKGLALCAALSGMNVAEICGLTWRHVNLGDEWRIVDGDSIAPWVIAVREQWAHGRRGPLKTGSRRRNIPMVDALAVYLLDLVKRDKWIGPGDPVFASRTGNPVDAHNLFSRVLKPTGTQLGIKLGWHVFRRTHATLADQLGVSMADRMAGLGHSTSRMTMHYTKPDMDRRRAALELLAGKISGVVQ